MTTTAETETTPAERHWLTRYDPDNGEAHGQLCDCGIGRHHDGNGNLSEPDNQADDEPDQSTAATETAPTQADTAATEPLTLTEFIAAQLCSKHILDGRFVQMSATADGTRIDIDIEHPFPPAQHIRVVAQLEVVVPDEVDVEEPQAELDGVEIGAAHLVEDLRNTLDIEAGPSTIVPADEPA